MRGSGSTSTAANGTSSSCSAATVRAEKPHAGASGVPFMNRITLCSEIASVIASRIGLVSPPGAEASAIGLGWGLDIGRSRVLLGWLDMEGSWRFAFDWLPGDWLGLVLRWLTRRVR